MIKVAQHKEDLEKIFRLRYEVLRKPWHQPYESAMDEKDGTSVNVFIEQENRCIACGRLDVLDDTTAQIRYMAVHPDFRRKHFGQQVLIYLENIAKEKGIDKIILHSRENALNFYSKNGYTLIRPSHLLFNAIQHYLMEKKLY